MRNAVAIARVGVIFVPCAPSLLIFMASQLSDDEIFALMRTPVTGIKLKDKRWKLKTYSNVVTGTKIVDWMVQMKVAFTREEAVQIGKRLAARKLIYHVANEHDFEDKYLFYRFKDDATITPKARAASVAALRSVPEHLKQINIASPSFHEMQQLAASLFHPVKGVQIKDHKWRARTYRDTFVGSEVVDWLTVFLLPPETPSPRALAEALGKRMQEAGIWHHIVDEHDFCDDYFFYTLVGAVRTIKFDALKTGVLKTEGKSLRYSTVDDYQLTLFKSEAEVDRQIQYFEMVAIEVPAPTTAEIKLLNKGSLSISFADERDCAEWVLLIAACRDAIVAGTPPLPTPFIAPTLHKQLVMQAYMNTYRGGQLKGNPFHEEWTYHGDGRVKCEIGGEDVIGVVYKWDGTSLTPDTLSGIAASGRGTWNGLLWHWTTPSGASMRYKWHPAKRTFLYLDDPSKKLDFQFSRHFLAAKEGGGEWIVEGEVPEPVVMGVQLMRFCRHGLVLQKQPRP